jgi:hypothetical protein
VTVVSDKGTAPLVFRRVVVPQAICKHSRFVHGSHLLSPHVRTQRAQAKATKLNTHGYWALSFPGEEAMEQNINNFRLRGSTPEG